MRYAIFFQDGRMGAPIKILVVWLRVYSFSRSWQKRQWAIYRLEIIFVLTPYILLA